MNIRTSSTTAIMVTLTLLLMILPLLTACSSDEETKPPGSSHNLRSRVSELVVETSLLSPPSNDGAIAVDIAEVDDPDNDGNCPDFVRPMAVDSIYMQGDKVLFNGTGYESLIDNNSWSPSAYPSGWKETTCGGDGDGDGLVDLADPGSANGQDDDEYNAPPPPTPCIDGQDNNGDGDCPDFVQPMARDSLYARGDKVLFNGTGYESVVDNNSWSPSAYPSGWKETTCGDDGNATSTATVTTTTNEAL